MKIWIYLTGFILVFISCKKIVGVPECEEPIDIRYNSSIGVIFKDKATNRYLYSVVNPLYSKDSITISPLPGNPLNLIKGLVNDTATNESYWGINFGNIYDSQTDSSSFVNELCKNYIVRYSYDNTDTIKVCFKSIYTKCGSLFQTLRIYHNNELVLSQPNTPYVTITILKN
jgi:hypothetical protein